MPGHRRLALAAFLDTQESRLRGLAERFGYTPWLEEFKAYVGDPRLTVQDFWYRYCRLRETEGPRLDAVKDEGEARAFYAKSLYPLYRQIVHRRHSAWRRVLWTMREEYGQLCEVGSGIAPVSAYCAPFKPYWDYLLVDVASPHLAFGAWRTKQRTRVVRIDDEVWSASEVFTALDVFEHLPDPLTVAHLLVERMMPGGYLHYNFIETDGSGLDLATASQRRETLDYLGSALRLVYKDGPYRVARKP